MDRYLLTILLSVLAFITLIALARSARVVAQYEKGLVLRLGRYRTTVDSGLTFLVPVIEDMLKVDMRERVINVEPQKVITKDNVSVTVDAVIYYRIIDPVKATFEVQHFAYAATTLAQTNLRNLIGDKSLDETLTARDTINANLRSVLDEATNTWGVKVTRVEVQKIDPPADITEAMSRQMKAERDKRANILEAEGVKQAQILQAEGVRQSEILRAQGDAQAKVLPGDRARVERGGAVLQGARRGEQEARRAEHGPRRADQVHRAGRVGPRERAGPGRQDRGARPEVARPAGRPCSAPRALRFEMRGRSSVQVRALPRFRGGNHPAPAASNCLVVLYIRRRGRIGATAK
jgi:regulator of protease activity HflC (stomatin/prohibitin superfamily)